MNLLRRRQHKEDELEEEIRNHLQMAEQDCINQGQSFEQAQHAARREFGNVDMVKETTRQMWGWTWLERLAQDLRYALRQMRCDRGFTLAVVLTLALGIGANVAVFSVVNSVLLRPLPFPHPEEVVQIKVWSLAMYFPFIGPTAFCEFSKRAQTLSGVAAYSPDEGNVNDTGSAERIRFMRVSGNFFSFLGIQPRLGRDFLAKEDQSGGDPVVLLSNGYWKRRFGGDPNIIGKTLRLDGKNHSVVGVLPASYEFPDYYWLGKFDLWTPLVAGGGDYETRMRWMNLIGRRKPSTTIQDVHDELTGIWNQIKAPLQSSRLQVMGWQDETTQRARQPLLLFLGAFGFVLLIACVSVANLWLSRIISREKEMAIRLAIGAKRIRIFRQLLTESLLFTLVGGSLGLSLAFVARNVLQDVVTEGVVRVPETHMDFMVVLFTLMVSLLASIVVVVAAASQASRMSLTASLKEGRNRAMGPGIYRMRRILVVLQVALVVTLLIGTGLLSKTLLRIHRVNPGYQPHNVLSMNIELMPKKYPTRQSKSSLLAPLLEEFKNVQGVKAAALTEGFPISLSMTISSLKIDGKAAILPEGRSMAPAAIYGPCEVPISDDYFKTLGIPILKGRTFSDQEGRNNARLAVVNEEFVRRYVPSKDPIGLQVIFNEEETPRTIIGLVKSTYEYLTQQTLRPMIYTHFLEQYSKPPWPGYAPPSQSMVLIAKHDGNTAELAGAARRILQQLDPDQVINKTATLDEMLSEDYRQQQSVLILIGTSSVLALVLAFIGIYGVVSYHVTRRIQEIGIRRALGAGSGKIIRLILGQSTLSSFVGLLIGLAAAFALTRYIASMLYGVTPRDPVVFISISVVAITVSIIAGYIPSRRATRIELSTALRDE